MSRIRELHSIVVQGSQRTTLKAAGILPIELHGTPEQAARWLVLAHTMPPHHDRSLDALRRKFVAWYQPDLIVYLGGFMSPAAFDALVPDGATDQLGMQPKDYNVLHQLDDPDELKLILRTHRLFEDRVEALGLQIGAYMRSWAELASCPMIIVPSGSEGGPRGWLTDATVLSRKVQIKKTALDQQTRADPKNPVSDPERQLPTDFAELLGLPQSGADGSLRPGQFIVLNPSAAVRLNNQVLLTVGIRPLRQPGTAAYRDLQQYRGSGIQTLVRSMDGKVSDDKFTDVRSTVPYFTTIDLQAIECGHGYDEGWNAHLGGYDLRAPGFVVGSVQGGTIFAEAVPEIRSSRDRMVRVFYDGQFFSGTASDGGSDLPAVSVIS